MVSGRLHGEEMEEGSGLLKGEKLEGGNPNGCLEGDRCWKDPNGCMVRRWRKDPDGCKVRRWREDPDGCMVGR